jgi:L-Ala-D/L-Glu epimerase / N-acetyl-D-glutamate racemase
VRLVSATLYALQIPFLTSVRHSLAGRTASDSVIVRVLDADGIEGFGEAAPRPYVTGETPDSVVEHLRRVLWPAVRGIRVPDLQAPADLGVLDRVVPDRGPETGRHHAARAGLELAIIDWALRRRGVSAAALVPPVRNRVVYGGVITAGSPAQAARQAHWARLAGLRAVKVKVGVGCGWTPTAPGRRPRPWPQWSSSPRAASSRSSSRSRPALRRSSLTSGQRARCP